jgi:transposase
MAGKPIIMSQVKQMLRLRQSGKGIKTIAKTLNISKNTVKSYIERAAATQMSTADLLELDDPVLEAKLLAGNPSYKKADRYHDLTGEIELCTAELKKKGVNIKLLWEEYRQRHPQGYGYSQFCYHRQQFRKAAKPSMVLEHAPGEKLFVDFAGKQLSYIDRETGEIIKCQTFVASMPYSDYGFAMVVPSQKTEDFIHALQQCLFALGGVPQILVPDNLKSAVVKADKYEPELNRVLDDFANHYGMVVIPARAARPKDKALVENQVKLIYSRVYAKLRNRQFFDLNSLNQSVAEKMLEHNQTRMQQKPFCREERFFADEKPKLAPLPAAAFEIKHYKTLTVAHNNHVYLSTDKRYYSVPHAHIGKKASVVFTQSLVKIYIDGEQVACHIRNQKHGYSTVNEHLCSAHLFHKERSPEYYLKRGKAHSEELQRVMAELFARNKQPELVYKTCDGLLSLSRKTERERFLEACRTALDLGNVTYTFIVNLSKNGVCRDTEFENNQPLPKHANVRGANYYQ